MNSIIKQGIRNSFYVVVSQGVSFLLGVVKSLFLPILLGAQGFGYWQIYLLYLSYVGIFSFGFNDGIYLKYGGYDYNNLPKDKIGSGLRIFIITEFFTTVIVCFLALVFEPDPQKKIIYVVVAINIVISGLTGTLIYIFQITNQLKKYSAFSVIDKVFVLIFLGFLFFLKIDNYFYIVIVDSFSRIIVLLCMIFSCKDLFVDFTFNFRIGWREFKENVDSGIKLMFANLAGMLVLGFGRFVVERYESVKIYGVYSFAFSTLNLIMIFVSAIGLVIYPTLSRIDNSKYSRYYKDTSYLLSFLSFLLMLSYYPLKFFIERYMPDFISIFEYLPLVFTIIFVQVKMQILINPFYKLLRDEKEMLKANIEGLIIAALLVSGMYFYFQSIFFIVFGTALAMAYRMWKSDFYLQKKMSIKLGKLFIMDVSLLIVFMGCTLFHNGIISFFANLLIILIVFYKIILFNISKIKNIKEGKE